MKFVNRQLFATAILLAAALGIMTARAETDGDWTFTYSGSTATLTGYSGSSTSVTVPSTVSRRVKTGQDADGNDKYTTYTYTVTAINQTFKNKTSLVSISLPSTVTTIGASSFSGCSSLENIPIHGNISTIGEYAFAGCVKFKTVELGPTITTLGQYAFQGCSGIESVTLNSPVTLPNCLFANCTRITSVTIGGNVKGLGRAAEGTLVGWRVAHPFSGCPNIKTFIVGSGIPAIPDYYFGNYSGLCGICFSAYATIECIDLPNSITSIGQYAFSGCENLVFGNLSFPSLTSIGSHAFDGCKLLEPFAFPTSLTSIGEYAFAGCVKFKTVELGPNITTLGQYAFQGCSGIESVTLNSPVTLPNCLFAGCTRITSVTIGGNVTGLGAATRSGWAGWYCAHPFSGCPNIKTFTIGSGVSAIPDFYFGNYSYCGVCFPSYATIERIDLPNSITSIGQYAFSCCNAIKRLELPLSLTSIGSHAFSSCSGLKEIVLPPSLSTIPQSCFASCTSLGSVKIPKTLQTLEQSAFQQCSSLSNVWFSGTPPAVGSSAFSGVASGARGHYPRALASEWLPKIGSDGKWNGLIMHELSQPILRVDSASPVNGTITLAWDDGTDGQCVSSYSIYRGPGTERLPEYCVASNITDTTWTDDDYWNAEPVLSPLNYWVVAESDHFDLPESNRVETRHRFLLSVGYTAYSDWLDNLFNKIPQSYEDAKSFTLLCRSRSGLKRSSLLQNATTNGLRQRLQYFSQLVQPGDLFLFYIATHGSDSGVLSDAAIKTYDSNYSVVDLQEDIRTFPSGAAVVNIIVTCHSAAMIGDEDKRSWITKKKFPAYGFGQCLGNVAWITSCGVYQSTWTLSTYTQFGAFFVNHGFQEGYADHLLYGVDYHGGNGDGKLTLGELGRYARTFSRGVSDEEPSEVQLENEFLLDRIVLAENESSNALSPPTPPVDVSVSKGVFDNKIRVSWTASPNAKYYRLYCSPMGEASYSWRTFLQNGVGSGLGSFDDKVRTFDAVQMLLPFVMYDYRVQAINQVGYSALSDSTSDASGWRGTGDYHTFLSSGIAFLAGNSAVPLNGTVTDYATVEAFVAPNGQTFGESYIAGLNPTDPSAKLTTYISMTADGQPIISWSPDLNEGGRKRERVYTVEGRESLTEGSWGPTNANSRFFRVKVDLPTDLVIPEEEPPVPSTPVAPTTLPAYGLLYEPNCYVAQDNLVVNFDGIRNVGLLKAHDSNAAEWKNIGRTANDATFTFKEGDTSGWVADGFHFAGGAFGELKGMQNLGNSMTVQIVCDVQGNENSTAWPTFFGNPNDKANIYLTGIKSDGVVHFKADTSTGLNADTRARVTCGNQIYYLNAALDAPAHKQIIVTSDSFVNGWKTGTVTATNPVGSQNWTFGTGGGSQSAYDQRYLVGTIKAIRVYNKVLTDAELATNRAIDEARFFAGIPVTNVVVETAVPGLGGNEGGVFAIDDSGYTFSAPQKATKDGVVYSCKGYTIETWNGSSWSDPVSYSSYSYAATNTSAKVRLTWQWGHAHAAVPSTLDPLFDDYVTDGLILHIDGIRNVGADKPHNSSSPQWIDLVKGNVASFQHDEADASTWTDDGYYFGGRSFAQFASGISLTNTVTVQVVCDVTTNTLHKFKTSRSPNVLWPNLISSGNNDELNIYYDMNAADRGRLTFKNMNEGNVNLANDAPKDNWEGRYVTAIRNGNKNYIFQTTSIADAFSKNASTKNISLGTMRVGGADVAIGRREQRWFLGTIKAVRIYNRVLSDAELAQNRAIDEVRFFGAPLASGVVVASSVRGVAGNEPEGEYALPAGGYTFTAPATMTVGDDTYSCTGYTLETWDGSAWGSPVPYASRSYTASDPTAKVRLTWQWLHTAGPGYDAAFNDYATDGLVVHLDGIRNAGPQAAHDSGATAWADLSRKGGAAWLLNNSDVMVSGSAVTTSGWKADGYYFNGASHAVMNGLRTLDGNYTVQVVLDFDPLTSCREKYAQFPMLVGTTEKDDKLSIYQNQYNKAAPIVACKALNVNPGFALEGWTGKYMTMLFNGTHAALFPEENPTSWKSFSSSPGTRTLTFGGSNGNDDNGAWGTRYLTGVIKAIRIYGRALSNAELSVNRAADEVRFFGRAPAATGALVVTSDVEGLSGNQPNGAYRPAAGFAFTAPAEAVVDGTRYACTGYTLETWSGSTWSSPVSSESYSYPVDVSSASKRLTWNWRVASRLTKIKDYDVDDYVQTDLYLHFDGIRNVGKTAEHDNEATSWVNLGTAGTSCNASFDYAISGSDASSWADDGYNFTQGGKFALIGGSPNLGHTITIQVVCENPGGTGSWPHLFGSTNDFCNIYYNNSAKLLCFKMFNAANGGKKVDLDGNIWERKYVTADWQAGMAAIFQTVAPAPSIWSGKWDSKWTDFTGQPFYIGGVYFPSSTSNTDNRRLAGKIHAVRVYKRSLTDAELEQNRIVDEARFFNNPPESNVIVVDAGGVQAESGTYKVDGTWTFTATTALDDNGVIKPVTSYQVETWNGSAWVHTESDKGGSYTYDESAGKVRLTWHALPNAVMLIVR